MEQEVLIAVAIMTIRLIVGFMFFFQGYDKVFKLGLRNLIQALETTIGATSIPKKIIAPIAAVSSYLELMSGALLIVGIFTSFALTALCINLAVVSIGFSKYKPMWDESHVFVRLVLIIALMLLPSEWDHYSLQYLIR